MSCSCVQATDKCSTASRNSRMGGAVSCRGMGRRRRRSVISQKSGQRRPGRHARAATLGKGNGGDSARRRAASCPRFHRSAMVSRSNLHLERPFHDGSKEPFTSVPTILRMLLGASSTRCDHAPAAPSSLSDLDLGRRLHGSLGWTGGADPRREIAHCKTVAATPFPQLPQSRRSVVSR